MKQVHLKNKIISVDKNGTSFQLPLDGTEQLLEMIARGEAVITRPTVLTMIAYKIIYSNGFEVYQFRNGEIDLVYGDETVVI